MKSFIFIAGLLMLFGNVEQNLRYEPRRDCALADVAVRIVNELGEVVPDAQVTFCFFISPGKSDQVKCVSDADGWAFAKHKCNGEAYVTVNKEGYYTTNTRWKERLHLGVLSLDEVRESHKWSKETVQSVLILKRIINPQNLKRMIRMRYKIPATNQVVGFDMKVGDWCKPYGKGEYDDLQFRADLWRSPTNWFQTYVKLEMSMTNSVDGFYWASLDKFSAFKYAHKADTNALYKKELTLERDYRNGKKGSAFIEYPKDEYLIIRTRTKIDENGNLSEALYGIIGEALDFGEEVVFRHILNPNVNDINLELNITPTYYYEGVGRETNYPNQTDGEHDFRWRSDL